MTTTDEQLDPVLAGLRQLAAQLPFNRHLGVEVVDLRPGHAVTRLPADERLANHLGGVHAIAELAAVELAGALALSGRLVPLFERGFVPVVGGLQVRYTAPARGELTATAEVGGEVLAPAMAAADAGERPRFDVEVRVTDVDRVEVAVATVHFVYLAHAGAATP